MNWKLTLLMISAVLLIMMGAGGASAYISYLMGREALKVVTQPDTDSNSKADRKKPLGGTHKGLKIIDEKKILINVYNHKSQDKKSLGYQSAAAEIPAEKQIAVDLIQPEKFPLSHQSGGVTMEVSQVKIQGNSIILNVSLRNDSPEAVRFLYSFLDVRDDQNRPLSAIADGLPGELLPNRQPYLGKFIIPATLLDNSQNVSISLEDYPEQKLELKINSIPVARR